MVRKLIDGSLVMVEKERFLVSWGAPVMAGLDVWAVSGREIGETGGEIGPSFLDAPFDGPRFMGMRQNEHLSPVFLHDVH